MPGTLDEPDVPEHKGLGGETLGTLDGLFLVQLELPKPSADHHHFFKDLAVQILAVGDPVQAVPAGSVGGGCRVELDFADGFDSVEGFVYG